MENMFEFYCSVDADCDPYKFEVMLELLHSKLPVFDVPNRNIRAFNVLASLVMDDEDAEYLFSAFSNSDVLLLCKMYMDMIYINKDKVE